MKFVYFYLLTIIITRETEVNGSGDFTPDELEYLSKRLYPAECLRLMNVLSKSSAYQKPCRMHQKLSRDSRDQNAWLCCLEKLENWNDRRGQRDRNSHDKMGSVLRKMGRADLAAYLAKNVRQVNNKIARTNAKRGKIRRDDELGPGIKDSAFVHGNEVTIGKAPVTHEDHREGSVDVFGPQFTLYAVIGSTAILACLGCITLLSYRRAYHHYQCYMGRFSSKDEEKAVYDEATTRIVGGGSKGPPLCKDCGNPDAKPESRRPVTSGRSVKSDEKSDKSGKTEPTGEAAVTGDKTEPEPVGTDVIDDGSCKCSPPAKRPPRSCVETMRKICCCGKKPTTKKIMEDVSCMRQRARPTDSSDPSADEPSTRSPSDRVPDESSKPKTSLKTDFLHGLKKMKSRSRRSLSAKKTCDPRSKRCTCEMCRLFNAGDSSTDGGESPAPERKRKKSSPLKRLKKRALKLSPRSGGMVCR